MISSREEITDSRQLLTTTMTNYSSSIPSPTLCKLYIQLWSSILIYRIDIIFEQRSNIARFCNQVTIPWLYDNYCCMRNRATIHFTEQWPVFLPEQPNVLWDMDTLIAQCNTSTSHTQISYSVVSIADTLHKDDPDNVQPCGAPAAKYAGMAKIVFCCLQY